jgi:hypothetical protein
MRTIRLLMAATLAPAALAQQPTYMEKDVHRPAAADAGKPQGWAPRLKLGSNLSFNHNSKVVGSPDGSTFQFGVLLETTANWRRGQHEWQNSLSINEAQSKTPLLDDFIKSLDTVELKSVYLYHLARHPWFGPFGRFRLQSSLLQGDLLTATDVDYNRHFRDGSSDLTGDNLVPRLRAQEKFKLTDPFEPLLLRESVGAFAVASDTEKLKMNFKVGPGAQETIVGDGFVVTGTTPFAQRTDLGAVGDRMELKQLEDVNEIGVEFDAEASGKATKDVSWSLTVDLLQPFYTSIDTGSLEGVDLMQVDVAGRLSVKLNKWASLDYVLLVKRIPLVVDEVQVTNGLLLAANFEVM